MNVMFITFDNLKIINILNVHLLRLEQHFFLFWILCCNLFISYLPTPPLGQDMTQGQFLSGV